MSTKIARDQLHVLLKPGQRVFLSGASGAPQPFLDNLYSDPARSRELQLLTSYIPGVNLLDMERLHNSVRVSGPFIQPSFGNALRDGPLRALAVSYGGFVSDLQTGPPIDLCVLQVSPPDAMGYCSLGPMVEFLPTVLSKSRRVLALINARVPRIPGSFNISLDDCDYLCEFDQALPSYSPARDEISTSIASLTATLIENDCTLQLGLGKLPTALYSALGGHQGLRLHSGMLSDGVMQLAAKGVLDHEFSPTACALLGSESFYTDAVQLPRLKLVGCATSHHPGILHDLQHFTAVNSALEVDLFGQCNMEYADGRAVSGVGGAPDFARAARLCPYGRSIITLGATCHNGEQSRIVPCLSHGSVISVPRVDVEFIVTEYGVADLRAASLHERAEAIIAVAAPGFRAGLQEAWRSITARL